MKTLLIEAQMRGYAPVKDGSMNFNFRSNREVSSDEVKLIADYYQQNGWLAFKIDELDSSEIPDTKAQAPGLKSNSTRLREVLFAKHIKTGGTKDNFSPYYNKAMEGFINAVTDSF